MEARAARPVTPESVLRWFRVTWLGLSIIGIVSIACCPLGLFWGHRAQRPFPWLWYTETNNSVGDGRTECGRAFIRQGLSR
jgi:hypothetical protein